MLKETVPLILKHNLLQILFLLMDEKGGGGFKWVLLFYSFAHNRHHNDCGGKMNYLLQVLCF